MAAILASCTVAVPARADGDPASDVLAVQTLFLPADAAVPAREQTELGALVHEAARSGLQLRVAIIASASDLGSITELWRQPQTYARFLEQELALVFHGVLLVVMPNGYGTYRFASSFDTTSLNLRGLPVPRSRLGTAAIGAVRRLAADLGHPLSGVSAGRAVSGRATDRWPWIVFALGCLAVAAAWAASLRARPLKAGRPSG
jgi:hypothetical protein